MEITVNGKRREFPEPMTVRALTEHMHYRRASVWLNGRQLLASDYDATHLKSGDQVKILRIVGGG